MSALKYTDRLPESIRDLIDVIGLDAAEIIVNKRGGVPLNVPVRTSPEHWLWAAIGPDAFRQLVHHYRGEEIWIPRCHAAFQQHRRQQIIDGRAAGDSTVALALRHHVSDRYVRQVLAEHRARADEDQLDLFEDSDK